MKKLLLIVIVTLLAVGCSKDDSEKYCWKFTIQTRTTIYDGSSTKSSSQLTKTIICDLTKSETEQTKEKMYNISTSTQKGLRLR
nr:MAG TPA: Protein involved in gliding motility 9 Secretion System Type.5A [Caudoviricetes sp.]